VNIFIFAHEIRQEYGDGKEFMSVALNHNKYNNNENRKE